MNASTPSYLSTAFARSSNRICKTLETEGVVAGEIIRLPNARLINFATIDITIKSLRVYARASIMREIIQQLAV